MEHRHSGLYSEGTGKNACRYLMPWRYAPLGEMLQREARVMKTGIFYETKPTSLLESTQMRGKRCKKPPENGTKSADRVVMQQLLERFGRCKSGMASNQKACRAEQSEAGAQALPACTLWGQAGMPVATRA